MPEAAENPEMEIWYLPHFIFKKSFLISDYLNQLIFKTDAIPVTVLEFFLQNVPAAKMWFFKDAIFVKLGMFLSLNSLKLIAWVATRIRKYYWKSFVQMQIQKRHT